MEEQLSNTRKTTDGRTRHAQRSRVADRRVWRWWGFRMVSQRRCWGRALSLNDFTDAMQCYVPQRQHFLHPMMLSNFSHAIWRSVLVTARTTSLPTLRPGIASTSIKILCHHLRPPPFYAHLHLRPTPPPAPSIRIRPIIKRIPTKRARTLITAREPLEQTAGVK